MAKQSPRQFDAMRADRVMDLASRRFGKTYTSKYAAVQDLSALPVAEQHSLKKRADPSKKQAKSVPSAYRFYDTRGGIAPAPSVLKLAQAVQERPQAVMRLARATTGMKVSSPAQALTLLRKFGSTDIAKAANGAYSEIAYMEGGRWRDVQRPAAAAKAATVVTTTVAPAVPMQPAAPVKSVGVKVGPVALMLVGAAMAEAARTSAKAAVASGKGRGAAVVDAAQAATLTGATGLITIGAMTKAAQIVAAVAIKAAPKIGPKLIPGVGLALYAGSIVKDGYDGFRRDGLRGAAMGAGDAATFGLGSAAVSFASPGRSHLNADAAKARAAPASPMLITEPVQGQTYTRTYTSGPKAGTTETVRKAR